MKRGWILAGALGGAAVAIATVVAVRAGRRPDYAPREVHWTVEQETRRLETELPLAASRMPYLTLDLLSSRIVYRISGMSPKAVPFQIDSIRGESGFKSLSPEGLLLLVLEERGAPREVITPPDPNKPVDPLKDPKVFPPDPPTVFTLSFDQPVKIQFLGEKDEGMKGFFSTLRSRLGQWLKAGRKRGEIEIRLRLPAEKAQEIYRGLYRGEKILVLGMEEPARPSPAAVKGG